MTPNATIATDPRRDSLPGGPCAVSWGAIFAGAAAALFLFISLLIGAFVASFAAIFGGRQREH